MKKILSINSVPYGSTCKVMTGISELASSNHDVTVATGYSSHPVAFNVKHISIGNVLDKALHMILAQVTGNNGCFSLIQTKLFLRKVDKLKPDIIHLHNIHGWFINLPMLFSYIKKNNIRVVWTLHDCWSFTGHCPHFTMEKCDKWKTGCYNCPSYRLYPQSLKDNSKRMYTRKKKWFSGVEDMTIVTPSQWLADLVKQSYLKDYNVKVINNGIDLEVFKPVSSNFRKKHNIPEGKRILLGVAFGWGEKKGLDVFIRLAESLDSEKYQIVLVGVDENTASQLPSKIISVCRTQDQKELAEIYSTADLFINPSREENYPTVNMEAIACGTPVLTFRTGGGPEIVAEGCGSVVEWNDVDALEKEVCRIMEERPFSKERCLEKSVEFDSRSKYKEYVKLYEVDSEHV